VNAEARAIHVLKAESAGTAGQLVTAESHTLQGLAFAALILGGIVAYFVLDPRASTGRDLWLAAAYTALTVGPPLALALIERFCAPAGPRKPRRQWLLHLQMNFTYHLATGIVTIALFTLVGALFKRAGLNLGWIDIRIGSGHGLPASGLLGLLGAFLAADLITDFFFYWFHRMAHKVPFLWAHHTLHHSDDHFDALTAGLQNWVEAIFHITLVTIPTAIFFKFDDRDPLHMGLVAGLVLGFIKATRYINHTNLRMQFGRFNAWYTSSQHHRIHHSRLPEHRDRNFASTYPIWDVVFRTYYAPARDEFPPTGVEGQPQLRTFWEAQTFSFRQWWKMYKSWRDRRAARQVTGRIATDR